MLIMFRVKNYRCFRDEVILDMRATGLREHPTHYTTIDNMKVLKTLAIYGANASGKSTIIQAMQQFEEYVQENMFSDDIADEDHNSLNSRMFFSMPEPFALTQTPATNIEMEIVFHFNNHLYQYGFELNHTSLDVVSEWLLLDNEIVYELCDNRIEAGREYKKKLHNLPRKRTDRLYLSVLDYFADGVVGELVKDIKRYFSHYLFVDWKRYYQADIPPAKIHMEAKPRFLQDPNFKKQVVECVHAIDVGIVDIEMVPMHGRNHRTGESIKRYVLKTVHDILDESGSVVDRISFPLRSESTGTVKFLTMIQVLLEVIENGGTFVIDELSQSLHPLLTRFILDMFQSENNVSGAQLIFTTHDTSLLNKNQFRRDEIGFIEKNNRGESTMFTLADLKVRSDATYVKDYFGGRYGAIPIIKSEGGTI